MNCRECQGLFSEILDGRLPAGTAAEARAHLSACSSCSEGYRDFARTLASLKSEPLETVPDGFEEAVLGRLGAAGARKMAGTPLRELPRVPRRPAPVTLAAAGSLAAAGVVAAFLLVRILPSRPPAEVTRAVPAEAAEVRKLRGELDLLREDLRQARSENRARASAAAAGEEERNRQAREREAMQESLSRNQERCGALEKEKQSLGKALGQLQEERDGLARVVEDLQRKIEVLTAPEPPVPQPTPAPRRVAVAPPPLLQGPAAVALDHRRGSEGELSIDLRGPDSRVVPGLIALALAEDDELGNLALNLLRERVGNLPAGGSGGQPAEDPVPPPRAFFQSVGNWLGERVGLERDRDEEQEAPPLTAGERRREVERIEELWRSLHAGGDAPARKL